MMTNLVVVRCVGCRKERSTDGARSYSTVSHEPEPCASSSRPWCFKRKLAVSCCYSYIFDFGG